MSAPTGVALRGRVVTPDAVLDDAVVVVRDGRIAQVVPASAYDGPTEQAGGTVLPGLVDVHTHGAVRHAFPEGDRDAGRAVARHHHAHGTTTLLASLVSAREPDLLAAVAAVADLADEGTVAGVHLEGPFLSPARRGAHEPAALVLPDTGLLERAVEAGRGHVRTMTYAPELPGAEALAARARALGVLPSVGHTDADARTTSAALADGGTSVTHLFNGMPPLHHRSPGPVAASLRAAAKRLTVVELIADGVHLADETVAAVLDLVGPDHVALVSDAMGAAGVGDGGYRLGGLDVEVVDGVARLAGDAPAHERSIAGGTARLVDVVRRVVQHAGVDLLTAVRAAATTPARLVGLDRELGAVAAGLRADLLVVDEELRPVRVMRGGSWL
jgi:N-acetylglucosamine-6-phosphate deacetylase